MVSDDQIKNIVDDLSVVLRDLLSSVFNGKNASKATSLIDNESSQTLLAEFVKTHMTVSEKKKKKNTKKKKDPDAPKKNCSSYIFFCKDTRTSVKENNPEFKGTEITKELGRLWKELDEEQKVPFVEQADLDKVRYQDEMKTHTPSEASKESGKKPKKTRKPGPKKASSSYLFFCKDQRPKTKVSNPEMDAKDITRELGRMWKEDMTDKKKKKFEKLAAQDKARYDAEKEAWNDKSVDSKSSDDSSDSEKKTKPKKTNSSNDDSRDSEKKTKPKKTNSSDDDRSDSEKKTKPKKTNSSDDDSSDSEKKPKPKPKTNSSDDDSSDSEKKPKPKPKPKPKTNSSDDDSSD